MVAQVIPLSRALHRDADEGRDFEAWEEDFEAWEEYVVLFERGDFPALVRLYEEDLRRWPHDVNTQCDLGDTYIRNGQPQRAIELLVPLHRADPDQLAYQHVILDALFALGRTEKDFDWVVAPRVYRLGPEVLDVCFGYLRSKRRPRHVVELVGAVLLDGYRAFSYEELVAALRADPRFVVGEGFGLPHVAVARGGAPARRRGG
jgi:tetratricopeptide (TPR) repeat protein